MRDLEPYFKYREIYVGPQNSLRYIIVSRRSLVGFNWGEDDPTIGQFRLWPMRGLVRNEDLSADVFRRFMPFFDVRWEGYDELFLSTYLALLAQGQITLEDCPELYEEPLHDPKILEALRRP